MLFRSMLATLQKYKREVEAAQKMSADQPLDEEARKLKLAEARKTLEPLRELSRSEFLEMFWNEYHQNDDENDEAEEDEELECEHVSM